MPRNFMELLKKQWADGKFVCVGLDLVEDKIPDLWVHVCDQPFPALTHLANFNQTIIDATADTVCAYKPNRAFYDAMGQKGRSALHRTIEYIHGEHPEIPVILDAKVGDIGDTNKAYVKSLFGDYEADAITVNPYLGMDKAADVFLEQADKGVIVLCKTSNKGAGELQDRLTLLPRKEFEELDAIAPIPQEILGRWAAHVVTYGEEPAFLLPLCQLVALRVSRKWNAHGNCCLVVGATYPEELKIVRQLVGDMPILVPGIGKQGGDLSGVVKNGMTRQGGLVINSSSGIIFASNGRDFAEAARRETLKLHEAIIGLRKEMRP